MYRFLRCFLCLLIVCCLIINLSPIKAEAMSGGLLAPLVSGAAVTVSAPLVIAAGLIALGIMAGTNDDFQRVVGNAVDSLGDWVKDGTVELIQTVDTLGKKAYYVAGDMLEDLRNLTINAGVVIPTGNVRTFLPAGTTYNGWTMYNDCVAIEFVTYKDEGSYYTATYYHVVFNLTPNDRFIGGYTGTSTVSHNGNTYWYRSCGGRSFTCNYNDLVSSVTSAYPGVALMPQDTTLTDVFQGYAFTDYKSDFNVTLGQVSSVPVDGTSAREWSEEYTNRGLYVVEGSGGSSTPPEDDPGDDGNDNNGKWYWPLVLGAAAFGAGAGIGALTQQDQWTGETPQEFDDYTPTTNYEVLPAPDVEFGSSVILNPVVVPDQGGDDGDDPGSVPDDGEDPSVTPDGGKDYSNWFAKIVGFLENIWNSILELPSKFATWFDNIISEIQELPSKFATWFENIISAIQELPSKFAEWFGNLISCLERIWESICNIPEAIGNVLRSIFVPSEDFLTEKVQDLRNRFNWIEPILGYGNYIKAQFIDPVPPVVYVHLGDAEGSYNYGGTVKFLDMSWYERYKSQGDAIISGFLWALFAWRMYVKLPGIINGVAGDVGHISYGESAWQKAEARKERKEKGGKNK